MKLRSKLYLTAALGLAFGAAVAHAQLSVNVSEQATFGPFVGGINNNVTNNGSFNTNEVITTGTPLASQFSITYVPLTGPTNVTLNSGTLNTVNFVFASTTNPLNYFTSLLVQVKTDFDNNGTIDLTQNYTLNLSPYVAPNGLTGINYTIVPNQNVGSVVINDMTYAYASVVSNSAGTLFDGSSTTAAIQFQFLATPVPEPSTYALAGVAALGGIVAYRRRRNQAKTAALAV